MANVFGNPITNTTLMQLPEYLDRRHRGIMITPRDRAMVAFNQRYDPPRSESIRVFVEGLKNQFGPRVATLCMVYNATGDTIRFVTSQDWWGHIGATPYPEEIANGQWGGFLHVKRAITPDVSEAAVVYGGRNNEGQDCDWMLAWSNPWGIHF